MYDGEHNFAVFKLDLDIVPLPQFCEILPVAKVSRGGLAPPPDGSPVLQLPNKTDSNRYNFEFGDIICASFQNNSKSTLLGHKTAI